MSGSSRSSTDPAPSGPVIGLFGVSGVGKSFFARELAALVPDLLHLRASELLRNAHGQSSEALRTASSEKIGANQTALLHGLVSARRGREHLPVVIDAHSLIDNDQALVPIAASAILPLGISLYAFLEEQPETIVERRRRDERRRPERTAAELFRHQEMALEICRGYAAEGHASFLLVEATARSRSLRTLASYLAEDLTERP